MLSILINNESKAKSYIKTQRVLSKYLPQLSVEGLEELKKELMEHSSRYMSISCISIKNKHTHNLLWILGNKDYFDNDTGVYAMKTKKSSVAT
jgi:hypothetical protein